jgi:hypothetical protein
LKLPGFIGPTYTSLSPNVDAERTVNLYPEIQESPGAKARIVLYPTPGLSLLSTPGGNGRTLFSQDGRCFIATGNTFFEIYADGSGDFWGGIADDGLPATISSNGTQLFITSGGLGYIFTLSTNVLEQIAAPGFPDNVSHGAFIDGYFIALKRGTRTFQISGLFDGFSWDALDKGTISAASDNLVALIADHRELWLLGSKTIEVYYNSGNPDFPFDLIQGSLIEQGCIAPFSVAKIDNTIFWLGGNEQGAGIVWRAQGYLPQRVSNHAVETAFQSYGNITDAVAYTHQDKGHSYYTLWFPAADKTWRYDVATGMWHELGYWDGNAYLAHWGCTHTYCFGQHLLADRRNGNIYVMTPLVFDDAGTTVRRMRQAPHLSGEQLWNFYKMFQLDLQAGVGLTQGQGSDPQVALSWSDDGGHRWSNEYWVSAGKLGDYAHRSIWRRLGKSRDRIFRIVVTDPVFWVLIDAFIDIEQGIS